MIATIDRKYFVELVVDLAFAFAVITAIALLAIATVAFYRFPGLDLTLYFTAVKYMLVQALTYLLPLSTLIAVVMVYGRASADHEVTTLKASGVHPFRLLLPGLLLALLVGGVCLEVETKYGPWAIYKVHTLPESQAVLRPLLERAIAEGRQMVEFESKRGDYRLYWNRHQFEADGGVELGDVVLDHEEPARGAAKKPELTSVKAERAIVRVDERLNRIGITLVGARVLSGSMAEMQSAQTTLYVTMKQASERTRLKFQSARELAAMVLRGRETLDAGGTTLSLLRRFELEDVRGRLQERFARSASPLAFLLLGFPLALVFRSGNRMVAFLLVTLVGMFVYYPTDLLSDVLLEQRVVGPLLATWSSDGLIASIGLLLLLFVVRR